MAIISHDPKACRTPAPDVKLIDLKALLSDTPPWRLFGNLLGPAEYLLAIDKINAIHRSLSTVQSVGDYCRHSLKALDIDYALSEQELARISADGPLVIVANHPFGGIEGIILTEVLMQVRSDVRILGNYLLTRLPALAGHIIPLNPFNPQKAARFNARSLKDAIRWVADGGALLTFPAGEVSHLCLRSNRIKDAPWSPHVADIARKTKAKVLPVYIHGRNSMFFNLMGLIHPRLRTMLLPREMVNKKASLIELTVGSSISRRKLAEFESSRKAAEFLYLSTYFLKHRKERKSVRLPLKLTGNNKVKTPKPIIAPVPRNQLLKEIHALGQDSLLVLQKEYSVYITTADESPAVMHEIGRLRESSFRDVGEGTGFSWDIDDFDKHYLQLFLWNNAAQEIAGAYRMGLTDRILSRKGPEGLYSTTLFNYKSRFFDHLNNALELGRSFIRTEYQKKFGCLSILWRGIGEYVARNPRYRHLFGPVSISRNYHIISRNLMVAFLSRHSMNPDMAALVKPRRPFRLLNSIKKSASSGMLETEAIEDISILVSEVEKDNKGVPTLIKHYLKLNGQFLAFNLDKAFADVIDGLIWVDLVKTDPKILDRFMGPAGAMGFHSRHDPDPAFKAA